MAEQETEKQLSRRAQRRAEASDQEPAAQEAEPQDDVVTGAATGEEIREQNRHARRAAASQRRASRERERQEAAAIGLDAGEIVDDALVRSGNSLVKWTLRNRRLFEGAIVLGIVGWAGSVWYSSHANAKASVASDALSKAVNAQTARIGELIEGNPLPHFETREKRQEAAAAAFAKATEFSPNSGTAMMALVGRAGTLLDAQKWDEALQTFEKAKAHPEAAHEPELFALALEGVALAQEGKGNIDAALATYKSLEGTGTAGFVGLAQFQQARLLFGKGDVNASKALLTKASASVGPVTPEALLGRQPPSYLQAAIKELQARVAPGGASDIQDMMRQIGLQELGAKAAGAPQQAPAPAADEKAPAAPAQNEQKEAVPAAPETPPPDAQKAAPAPQEPASPQPVAEQPVAPQTTAPAQPVAPAPVAPTPAPATPPAP